MEQLTARDSSLVVTLSKCRAITAPQAAWHNVFWLNTNDWLCICPCREGESDQGRAGELERAQRERVKKKREKKATLALICPTIRREQFQFLFVSSKNFHKDVFCYHASREWRELRQSWESEWARGERGGAGGGGVRGVGRGEETLWVQRRGSERRGVRMSWSPPHFPFHSPVFILSPPHPWHPPLLHALCWITHAYLTSLHLQKQWTYSLAFRVLMKAPGVVAPSLFPFSPALFNSTRLMQPRITHCFLHNLQCQKKNLTELPAPFLPPIFLSLPLCSFVFMCQNPITEGLTDSVGEGGEALQDIFFTFYLRRLNSSFSFFYLLDI